MTTREWIVIKRAETVADNWDRMMKRSNGEATRRDALDLVALVKAVRRLRVERKGVI